MIAAVVRPWSVIPNPQVPSSAVTMQPTFRSPDGIHVRRPSGGGS